MENDFEIKFTSIVKKVLKSQNINDFSLPIDSLTYISLIVLLQKEFKIKFSASDVASMKTTENIKIRLSEIILSRMTQI